MQEFQISDDLREVQVAKFADGFHLKKQAISHNDIRSKPQIKDMPAVSGGNFHLSLCGNSGRLEHNGPVDPVGFEDVFGDDMLGNRPEGLEQLTVRVPETGYVVEQGIEPYIGDIILVKGEGDAPGDSGFWPGDT